MIARLLAWFAPSALATAAAVGAALLAALGAQTWRLHSTQAQLAAAKTVIAETKSVFASEKQAALASALRESEARRVEEQRRNVAHQELENEHQRLTSRGRVNAAAVDAAAPRLRNAAKLAIGRACPGNQAAVASGPPASDASRVLAVVFGEVETRVRALDRIADERGLAGTTCQKSYGALEQQAS